MEDIICRGVRGELNLVTVLRTENSIAFMDHRPVFKGHVLVSPLRHVDDLMSLPADAVAGLFNDVQRVCAVLPAVLGCEGVFVGINNRVSQSVPHLHVHLVPRAQGDGLRGFFWPRTSYDDGEAERYAERIRAGLR